MTSPPGAARCILRGHLHWRNFDLGGSTPRRAWSDRFSSSDPYRSVSVLWTSAKLQSRPVTSRPVNRRRTADSQSLRTVVPRLIRSRLRPCPRSGAYSAAAHAVTQSRKFPEKVTFPFARVSQILMTCRASRFWRARMRDDIRTNSSSRELFRHPELRSG